MTEMDYLKLKLEDTEKAFDKLHKRHMDLLKQQGELDKENEQLKREVKRLKCINKQLNHDLDMYEENNTNEVLDDLKIELTSRLNDCIEEFKE